MLRTLALLLLCCTSPLGAQRIWTGTPQIKQSLDKLRVLGSVLMIAAHPDDENTAVLAYFARGQQMETAYLSATRGEGGQNLIGSEQGDLLGRDPDAGTAGGAAHRWRPAVLHARDRLRFFKDARQRHSKSGAMTRFFRTWCGSSGAISRTSLSCASRAHRKTGTGIISLPRSWARKRTSQRRIRQRFPEQLGSVKVWKAKRLVWNAFAFNKEEQDKLALIKDKVQIDTGAYNAVLGESYTEIAGISRSQHRSQGMGAPENRGPQLDSFLAVAGDAPKTALFEGIDTSWTRIPGGAAVGEVLDRADAAFQPDAPEKILPLLLDARKKMTAIAGPDSPWVQRKLAELDETIAQCAGLFLDANADRYEVAPGSKLKVQLTALNRAPRRYPTAEHNCNGRGRRSNRRV